MVYGVLVPASDYLLKLADLHLRFFTFGGKVVGSKRAWLVLFRCWGWKGVNATLIMCLKTIMYKYSIDIDS
jgi:hypothetical protein